MLCCVWNKHGIQMLLMKFCYWILFTQKVYKIDSDEKIETLHWFIFFFLCERCDWKSNRKLDWKITNCMAGMPWKTKCLCLSYCTPKQLYQVSGIYCGFKAIKYDISSSSSKNILRYMGQKSYTSSHIMFGSSAWRTFHIIILKWKRKKKAREANPSVPSALDCSFPKNLAKEAFRRIAFSALASRVFHHVSQPFHRSVN